MSNVVVGTLITPTKFIPPTEKLSGIESKPPNKPRSTAWVIEETTTLLLITFVAMLYVERAIIEKIVRIIQFIHLL